MIAQVRMKNNNGKTELREMSIRSILMYITIEVLGHRNLCFS